MNVYLEYEGKPVPASDLTWGHYSPCGCQCGVMVAQSGSFLVVDEEAAWKEFYESAAIRKREKARGYTFKLLLHADGTKALGSKCPHTPMWGVPNETPPKGFAWGKPSKARKLHLIPFTGNKDRPNFATAQGGYDDRIIAECGESKWSFEVDPWMTSEFLKCDKCVSALNETPA